MPFEESLARRKLKRLGQGRPTGQVTENLYPVRPLDTASIEFRDNARFEDQTGVSLIGYGTIGTMTT